MFATFIISSIAICFAYLAQFKKFKYGLEFAFIILTTFVAVRFNWGNDYLGYLEIFQRICSYASTEEAFRFEVVEFGWVFLNRLFKPLGFFGLTIALTIFEYFVLYRFVKRYVPKEWFWLAVFIFTFNPAFLLVTSSMMRQFLAMTIVLISIKYIFRRKWYVALLFVILASSFHASALILLPFCYIGFISFPISRMNAVVIFAVYLVLHFSAATLFKDYFFSILALEQFDKYEVYVADVSKEGDIGLGVVFNMILLFLILLNHKYQYPEVRLLFLLFFISNIFSLFGTIAPLTVRLGYYFAIFMIVVYPWLFITMKKNLWLYMIIIVYIVITVRGFFQFFNSAGIWFKHFYSYQTIFSATEWM